MDNNTNTDSSVYRNNKTNKVKDMLTIKNKEKLRGEVVLRHTTDGYYVEDVCQYPDHYAIHIRCSNKTIGDEILILQRDRVADKQTNYYTLYNELEPQRRLNLTSPQIKWKIMFLHNIETILKMNN
jgi:hypothetical protein